MISVRWDPRDYAASSTTQTRWGRELMNRVQWRGDEHVLDVGCGDGKLTAEIARCVPRGRVLGVDASPEMIRHARATHAGAEQGRVQFEVADAGDLRLPAGFDLVFSNAALHWVSDHPAFLRGAAAALHPGGRLLTSCGGRGNAEEVFHAVRAVMRDTRWREGFRQMEKPYFLHGPDEYLPWLVAAGFSPVQVELAPKDCWFASRNDFAAWLRTTWLPYTQRVPEPLRAEFITAVAGHYLQAHPADDAGRVCVRMVRLEVDATKLVSKQPERP